MKVLMERTWLQTFREGMTALGRPAFHVMARIRRAVLLGLGR